ncbi:MAG: ROK family protein [Cytophagales bacterium]|nr:ROK family protein [Cytophagales bacterium]
MSDFAIGIDLGGTNIKGVLMKDDGHIIESYQLKTCEDPNGEWKQNVIGVLDHLKSKSPVLIKRVGLSAPGLANSDNSKIAHLPDRLPGLENFLWAEYLQTPTLIINDAHAALMAEHQFGVLQDFQNALLITLGTGVGGGILINGQLHQGMSQMAGHLGHMGLSIHEDETSILGMPGSLEYAIGNYSVHKRSHGRFKNTYELVEAFERGEHWATLLWLESVRKLSLGMVSLINILSPEAIALSGGITMAGNALLKPLSEYLEIFEFKPKDKTTKVFLAKYGEMSGAIGAAAFAMKNI